MLGRKRAIYLSLILIAVVTALTITIYRSGDSTAFANQQEPSMRQKPVAEYSAADHADAARRAKSSRHNKRGSEPIKELAAGDSARRTVSHWWVGLPALPVPQSGAIVVGEVVDAQAYLSGDKTDVYSEFTVRVEEVLKADGRAELAPGSLVVTERQGGAVRFSSGSVQHYGVHRQGVPLVSRRYVLFLKPDDQGQDFQILTGYELRAGRVFPLDGEDVQDKRAELQFARYRGSDEVTFLNAVREAIKQALQAAPETGGQSQ